MKKRFFLTVCVVCAMCLVSFRLKAQSDSTSTSDSSTNPLQQYMPFVDVPLIGKATVVLPGQGAMKVSKDDLGDVLSNYVEQISNQLSPNSVASSITGNISSAFNNAKDALSDEVSSLIGETENKIMQGITDQISQIASSIAGLETTPVSEVDRLKKMVAEGYSDQQKISYQNLKVDYAWKKSNTTLSTEFCNFYNQLNVKGLFEAVGSLKSNVQGILNSGVFSSQERQGYQSILNSVSNTQDLASAINIICNKGSDGKGSGDEESVIWMSQGERMDILQQCATILKKRIESIGSIRNQLRKVYVYRYTTQQASDFKQGSFKSKSALNHVSDY